jgi:dephospho-CoA kinase
MRLIGLTGGIGAGKSVVAAVWARCGARVLTADDYGRRVLMHDRVVRRQLLEHFGRRIVRPDGGIDRGEIARRAFASERLTKILNRIVGRPLVRLLRDDVERLRRRRGGVLVVDAALICEWGSPLSFDLKVLVTAPRRLKLKWLSRRGLSYRRAAERMRAQWPDSRKRRWAHVEIRNDGTRRALQRKAVGVWRTYVETH